jgi:CBS domain-containing protein
MLSGPISVQRWAHLATAQYLMRLAKQTAVVVVDDLEPRRPLGVLAQGDLVAAVAHGKDPDKACVADIVVKKPLSVQSAASVREAALAMLRNGVKYLPVVDGEHLVGIVAVRDVQNGI